MSIALDRWIVHARVKAMLVMLLPILLSGAAYLWWSGSHVLAPARIGWVMAGLDTPAHYLGWQFFRHTAWLQWPLGANPAYGSDASSSVVFADSIPLLAFFFKIFSAWLPADFQYVGLWVLCCFLLQGWFACKWLAQAGIGHWPAVIGCGFFVCAPLFVMRTYLHPALCAQWVLLAGFCLYGRPSFNNRRWSLLLAITTLIHAYLLVMLAALWAADAAQRLLQRELGWKRLLLYSVKTWLMVLLIMYAAGYFYAVSMQMQAFRSYADLLSPLWPGIGGAWSTAMHSGWFGAVTLRGSQHLMGLNWDPATSEGFAYMGLGFILLVLLLPICLFRRKHAMLASSPETSWIFATIACCILALYALGPHIHLGSRIVLSYPLPAAAERIYGTFRAAGRMLWPLWYLSLFATICALAHRLPPSWLTMLLSLALVLQVMDIRGAQKLNHQDLNGRPQWNSTLASPLWQTFSERYKTAVFLPNAAVPQDMISWLPAYKQLADFSAQHGMSINTAYTARTDKTLYEHLRALRTAQLLGNQEDPDSFYVLEDIPLWQQLICVADPHTAVGVLDGMRVVAPGWNREDAAAAGMQLSVCQTRTRAIPTP
jgi:hypothetical protein